MAKKNKKTPELTEDIEVIGPGQILAEARKSRGLSQQDVAAKLNFTVSLVSQIEAEQFDDSLPATFTRGYLKNYAKLVNVDSKDVLASYEMLGIAQRQGAEMQSFSKGTKKQAENNLLMWLTYLILVVLVALTVIWWWQNYQGNSDVSVTPQSVTITPPEVIVNQSETDSLSPETAIEAVATENNLIEQEILPEAAAEIFVADTLNDDSAIVEQSDLTLQPEQNISTTATQQPEHEQVKTSTVVFTFAGDCWVNIYDATGERIAWGIKKADYVMTISGQAPFNITLGKPELVAIEFNGTAVDMSNFGRGNIAKFQLPVEL